MECGNLMDIRMMDHIIVAGETGEMFSFKEHGYIDEFQFKDSWER